MLASTGYRMISRTEKIYVLLKSDYLLKHFFSLLEVDRGGELFAQALHFAFRALSPSLLGWSALGIVKDKTRIHCFFNTTNIYIIKSL